MRRLPILIVIDADSVKNIHPIRVFIERLICGFKNNPFMLEITYISIMYMKEASCIEIIPFMELYSLDVQLLASIESIDSFHGDTMSERNLSDVINCFLANNLLITNTQVKGDWTPTIILFGAGSSEYSLNIIDPWATRIRLLYISEEESNVSLSRKNIFSYSVKMEFTETNFLNLRDILQAVIDPYALAVGQEEPTILVEDIVVKPIL